MHIPHDSIRLNPCDSHRALRCDGCPQASTWQVPKSYAWRQVFVNEANEVLETSEPVDWEYEDLIGQHLMPIAGSRTPGNFRI